MVERIHVAGTDKGDILIYALSTCVWCKKAKSLLETKGIAYDYIFVDQQEGDDKKMTMEEVAKWILQTTK